MIRLVQSKLDASMIRYLRDSANALANALAIDHAGRLVGAGNAYSRLVVKPR